MAAASMSKTDTQASHSRSAASTPRRPSTAARSWSWMATFNRTEAGRLWRCPVVVVAWSYPHCPLVVAVLRVLAACVLRRSATDAREEGAREEGDDQGDGALPGD